MSAEAIRDEFHERPETAVGRAMYDMLLAVHAHIRRDPVIDRLQADHRRISDDLDAVEGAARALADEQGRGPREALVDALGALERNLLEHLDYEELNVATTVRRLRA
jgi:hypothetical protein